MEHQYEHEYDTDLLHALVDVRVAFFPTASASADKCTLEKMVSHYIVRIQVQFVITAFGARARVSASGSAYASDRDRQGRERL